MKIAVAFDRKSIMKQWINHELLHRVRTVITFPLPKVTACCHAGREVQISEWIEVKVIRTSGRTSGWPGRERQDHKGTILSVMFLGGD